MHHNLHQGKVGVLCLAPEEGLGVRDEELRAKHLTQINAFRGRLTHAATPAGAGRVPRRHQPDVPRCAFLRRVGAWPTCFVARGG